MKDTGSRRQRGTGGHSTDEGTAIQVPHCAPPCGDLTCWGWEGQRSNQEGETQTHSAIQVLSHLGNDGYHDLEIKVTSGHKPRALSQGTDGAGWVSGSR